MIVLTGDIGGTKTILQLALLHHTGRIETVHQQRYLSQEYVEFDSILAQFLTEAPSDLRRNIACTCLGVAGPVTEVESGHRQAKITNLPWLMDNIALQRRHQLPRIFLINDFHAIACGIEALTAEDIVTLHTAPASPQLPRLVVGAGTGLGVSQLMWSQGRYRVHDSEGGHVHFAPTSALQVDLLASLQAEFGRVSYERLVSGPGLVRIYRFLCEQTSVPHTTLAEILAGDDPAAIIAGRAQEGDALALGAINLFLSIYGGVAGDLALVTLAYGGVYIAGGIAPKLMQAFSMDAFLSAYFQKGRMAALINNMPLHVIVHPQPGLLGAALYAAQAD